MFLDLHVASKTTVKEVCDDVDDNIDNMHHDEMGKRCLDSSATMAENANRANKSLCEIPYGVTFKLMKSLDTDRGWEAVAAEAGFTFDKMQYLLRRGNQPDGSATRTLLWELGCMSYKVSDLYDKLKTVRRLREMQILEDYVNGKEENKHGWVEKKVADACLFVSIPQLPSKKMADNKPVGKTESGFSMSGSEINFNHLSSLSKSKAEVAGSKNYEDKIIPGTHSQSPLSSFGASNHLARPLQEADLNKNKSGPASHPQFPLPKMLQRAENYQESTCRISRDSGFSFPSKQTEHSNLGKPEMMGPQSYPASLVKDTPSSQSTPPNFSQLPSLSIKQQLDTTNSSLSTSDNENIASYSYRELFNVTDGFSDRRAIGEGAFGKVYLGTIRQLECAIKKLHSSTPDSSRMSDQVKCELAALSKYRHENIVTLYGHAQTESDLCLVYQYLVGGSLEDRLLRKNNTPPLNWERRLNILVGACKGLNFLHTLGDKPLIHGDIKSANILLDQYFEAKLGDMGQAQYASGQSTETSGFTHITRAQSTTKIFGTKAYMAPEITSGGNQSTKSDIYALGVVFLEVCSAKQAYDQTRNELAFLVNYFNQNVFENEESLWKEQFQDRTLFGVPDDIFIDVLKLASKCVKQFKKLRPDSVKLLSEVKDIYKRNREKIRDEDNTDSLSTSMQIDSRYTIPSYYQSTDNEIQHGVKDICPSQQTYYSKPVQLQQQILDQLHGEKAAKLELHSQSPLNTPSLHQHCAELCLQANGVDTFEIRSSPNSGSPVHSFPPNASIPEAFRLQAAYDSQPERKKIDRLSGLSQKTDQSEGKYASDPNKLQKMNAFELEHQKSIAHSNVIPQPGDQFQDHFPQADPKKMAQLSSFDDENFGKNSLGEESAGSLECDPVKMAFLKNFDDDVYRSSKMYNSPGKENEITSEAIPGICKTEDSEQIQKPLSNLHEEHSYNSTTSDYNNSKYKLLFNNPGINESEEVGLVKDENSHTTEEKNCEFTKYSVNHSNDRRPSDDNNIPDEHAENSNVATTDDDKTKPGKMKINNWMDRYTALKDQAEEDSCDSGNEEETNI